jgi:hypothetical protein
VKIAVPFPQLELVAIPIAEPTRIIQQTARARGSMTRCEGVDR